LIFSINFMALADRTANPPEAILIYRTGTTTGTPFGEKIVAVPLPLGT
jgi:hypothetical protein